MGGNNIKKGSFKDKIEISNDTVRRTFETIKPATTDELQLKYASLMGCLPKQITNLPLYYLIEEWYGVSYRLGGNTKAGIDCSSFTKMLFLEIYKKQLLRTAQEQYQQSTKLFSFDDMTEGDLVFFKSGRRHIGHVGVYLGNHFFVHASTSGGVMISSLHESYWNRRFAGGGRP
jgi:lipoprotein Spr